MVASGRTLENCQMKIARMICAARNESPASTIVSDICSSIRAPWVEMFSGATQVCRTMGIAEAIAITMMVTESNFAMSPSLCQLLTRAFCVLTQTLTLL